MSDTVATKTFDEFMTGYQERLGLVILGAGGSISEWVDGISKILVETCEATMPVFSETFTLTGNIRGSKGRTDLVLILPEDTTINVGKLAIFRIQYGDASWIDDFIRNYRRNYR